MILDGNKLFTVSTLYFVTSVFLWLQISSFVKYVAMSAHIGILGAFLVCYVIVKTSYTIKLSVTFYTGYLYLCNFTFLFTFACFTFMVAAVYTCKAADIGNHVEMIFWHQNINFDWVFFALINLTRLQIVYLMLSLSSNSFTSDRSLPRSLIEILHNLCRALARAARIFSLCTKYVFSHYPTEFLR